MGSTPSILAELSEILRGKTNLSVLALTATLRGAMDQMYHVVWQPFALSLGVSMRSLGGLESSIDLTRISLQPVIGRASDIHGRKRFLTVRGLSILTAFILFFLASSWHLLLLAVIFVGVSSAFEPILSSTVAESVEARGLGMAYSIIYTCYMVPGIFAPLLAGFLAARYGNRLVFSVTAFLALFGSLLIQVKLSETMKMRKKIETNWIQFVRALPNTLKPPAHLRGFYISMTVDSIAFGLGYRLLNGMLTESFGYTPYMLSFMSMAMMGAWAIAQIPLGRVVDTVGYKRFLVIAQLMSCGVIAGILLSKRFETVLAMQVLLGVSAAMWVPAEQAWIARNVEPSERAHAIGSFSTFRGLLAFPAPFLGGVLYDAFGFYVPLIINLIVASIDAILIAILVKK